MNDSTAYLGAERRQRQIRETIEQVDALIAQSRHIARKLRAILAVDLAGQKPLRSHARERDRRLVELLGDDWTTAARIAERMNLSVQAAQQALYRARARGVPIECGGGRGWRRMRDRSIWETWRTAS